MTRSHDQQMIEGSPNPLGRLQEGQLNSIISLSLSPVMRNFRNKSGTADRGQESTMFILKVKLEHMCLLIPNPRIGQIFPLRTGTGLPPHSAWLLFPSLPSPFLSFPPLLPPQQGESQLPASSSLSQNLREEINTLSLVFPSLPIR